MTDFELQLKKKNSKQIQFRKVFYVENIHHQFEVNQVQILIFRRS